MAYGISARLGTGTATLIANMQHDFAEASRIAFTAEKELKASIDDEQNLKRLVEEHGSKAATNVEKSAMGYAKLHQRKLKPVVEGLPAIAIELEKAVHISDLSALKTKAMELKKNLAPAKNQVEAAFREVRILFQVSKKNAEKATSRGILGGMKSILGLR